MKKFVIVALLALGPGAAWGQDTGQEKIVEQSGNWVGSIYQNNFMAHSIAPGPQLVVSIGNNSLNVFVVEQNDVSSNENANLFFDSGFSLLLPSVQGTFYTEVKSDTMPAFIHALTASKSVAFVSGQSQVQIPLAGTSFAINAMSSYAKEHDIALPAPFTPATTISNSLNAGNQFSAPSAQQNAQTTQPISSQPSPENGFDFKGLTCQNTNVGPLVQGEVQNNTGSDQDDLKITAVFRSSSGQFISSEDMPPDYSPILPGQTSPFKMYGDQNPAISTVEISIGTMGGASISSTGTLKAACQ